jgi:hypothetical protein
MNVLDAKTLFQMQRGISLQKINVLGALPKVDKMPLSVDFFKQLTELKSLNVQTLKNYNQRLEAESPNSELNRYNFDIKA